jgi:hypothetical protein
MIINNCRSRLVRSFLTGFLALALVLTQASCGQPWEATIVQPDGGTFGVDRGVLDKLAVFAEEVNGQQVVPLERVLVVAGHSAVETLILVDPDGGRRESDWPEVAERAWWSNNGQLSIGGEEFSVSRLEVEPPELWEWVEASITDIAPTVAKALDLTPPSLTAGQPLTEQRAERAVLIFMDGFGYVRYTEALDAGLIPYLSTLGEPLVGVTTYPPSTSVSTASLLTGAPPEVHGVDRRGIRTTDEETLFDVAASAGLETVSVEGESLAFNLRGSELQLSADLDGNGSTDDNVLANALEVLGHGVPDLLYIHFHAIDDAGHTYGPGASEECAAIEQEDAAVGQIVDLLPQGTLVIIFADHGMHAVDEEGRLGNHGHLVERDMFIPIFVVWK